MPPRLGKWLSAALALTLIGCAGPEMATRRSSLPGRGSAPLPSLDGENCTSQTVVALCAGDGCRFHWCNVVAPSLASLRRLRDPDGTWVPLPGAIDTHPS